MEISKFKIFLADLFFPKFCFGCQREGSYLCQDCQSVLDISRVHQTSPTANLSDLYCACEYGKPLVKKLIRLFKYEPFAKGLSDALSSLVIDHFQLLDCPPPFLKDSSRFCLIAVPLEKRRLKWRGFNQSEELGKELAEFLKIPLLADILFKEKETPPQMELTAEERKENIKGAFGVKNQEKIKDKEILLIDDVYTTGATMEECAKTLKMAGAKEVIGIVVARG